MGQAIIAAMTLFCFLWTPFFYLFWRSLNEESASRSGGAGETLMLMLGSAAAFLQFLLGSFVSPGGFGFSRWLSACVDIVGLPAAVPFLLCFLLALFKIIPADVDFTNLAFLWLIPASALRALSWSTSNDPVLLVAVPVLWTGVACGAGFFARMVQGGWGPSIVAAAAAAALLPFVAASSYWAFFRQNAALGAAFMVVTVTPALVSLGKSITNGRT